MLRITVAAMWTGYLLNAATGLRVLAGTLTTDIAAGTSGKWISGTEDFLQSSR
ncbi:hypothetical protein K503DRAFT_777107 [Rhizopogon vinicolor AM-OR11-026]|uniref:Uncharacterized protein n=1 Tax=Rhizopogon vinicolor AM-OR11-026 TaxID=1314800 RepID=A0A1B7MHC1_9AGAM|nr:hypothetical protein K503DRAFT_777107 [Rhizopogon vinicolor AM-OR11-026]